MEAALGLGENWLNLVRIELTVYPDNAAGIALHEKFGFEPEGTHRRYTFCNGAYADAGALAGALSFIHGSVNPDLDVAL